MLMMMLMLLHSMMIWTTLDAVAADRTNLWADTELNLDCFFVVAVAIVVAAAVSNDDLVVSVAVVECYSLQPMY